MGIPYRKGRRIVDILLYKGLKGKARIPTDDLIPTNRRCKNQHSLSFQIHSDTKAVSFPHYQGLE